MDKKVINGVEVHPIGIGTWLVGGGLFDDKTAYAVYENDEAEIKAIRYALSLGQNHIDTAQFYGAGHTEEIVGKAMQGFERGKIFLASKIWKSHASRLAVPRQVEEMLKRLQTSYLDLLYIHAPWPEISIEQCMAGMSDAVDAGLVKAVGVSNFNVAELHRAMKSTRHPISAHQILYNLMERSRYADDMRTLCEKEAITVVAYRPLERKKLASENKNNALQEIAGSLNATVGQIALRWLIDQPGVVVIPKASLKAHLDENIGAMGVSISESAREKLNQLSFS